MHEQVYVYACHGYHACNLWCKTCHRHNCDCHIWCMCVRNCLPTDLASMQMLMSQSSKLVANVHSFEGFEQSEQERRLTL